MTGYEALRERAAWIDLSARGKIRVTGEDRARLLHAMTTNHVNGLAAGNGLYAFFLNDKGRILADAIIYNLGDALLLDSEPETAAKLAEHLDRYIIADDAAIKDETARWTAIGIEGPAAVEGAVSLGIPAPENRYSVAEWGAGFVARVASAAIDGVRVFLPADQKDSFIAKLKAAGIPGADETQARAVRIENGIARFGEEISERYLVQETQAMHAVHTSKGCYLGQEIVERVRSRGQVHRVLTPVRIEGQDPPAAGTKLSADGKDIAEIASAAYAPALGEIVALAYVRSEAAESKPDAVVAGSEPPRHARIV